MAIIRLADKYKSKQNVQFTPARTYISSSNGITGSVYVFPNRSITQKDNIDERLDLAPMVEEGSEFSGTPIKAYDSNSLEQRRIEIYQGQFGKLIGGMFADALQYEYSVNFNSSATDPEGNAVAASYTGEFINGKLDSSIPPIEWDLYNSNTGQFFNSGAAVATRIADGIAFTYRDDDRWMDVHGDLFNTLPESDRDDNGKNFEIALGLLLDGAHPFTGGEDTDPHAWRKEVIQKVADGEAGYNLGNSSFTGTSPSDRYLYQFTGFSIFEDELGIPYLDSPLTSKTQVNPWPPEVAKWDVPIITNFVVSGYSDLSMHPRNATKKEILRKRADHNLFSSGSLYQKVIANRIADLDAIESGWWVHNNHSLCLSKYDTNKVPALCYANTSDRYKINWQTDKTTFEFWIKPCKEQVQSGTICHLGGNYGITLIPDLTSKKNDYYENYRIGIFFGTKAVKTADPQPGGANVFPLSSTNATGSDDGIYITKAWLKKDNWHHVVVRFGSDFNNGLLNVYVDGLSETTGNVDGIHNGSTRTDGFVNTGVGSSADDTLIIGGWSAAAGMTKIYGDYGVKQEHAKTESDNYSLGYAVVPRYQLKSELGDFRIWNVCKPEVELNAAKYKSLTATTGLICYINFQFDPTTTAPTWNRKGFRPNTFDAETSAEYYREGTFLNITSSNLASDYNKVQFCPNSGYIVGMPFVNVHSHCKEYKNSAYPIITQFLDLTDETNATLYPSIRNQTPANHKVAYFANNWENFTWLHSINSMIIPNDNALFTQDYTLNSKLYHKHLTDEMLKLSGEGIASTIDEYEISRFYDDEIYTIQDSVKSIDPEIDVFGGKEENFQTSALVSNSRLSENDYISPISTIFSIPQIYYGNKIHEETLEIKFQINDDGKVITIKDYAGTLYRTDTPESCYKSKVGHVDYGTGIIVIFSPLLTNIGITNFEIRLKGQKNMHVMQLDIPCGEGIANLSQNSTYQNLKSSANPNETSGNMTYISTIYLHDENLNIIGKVNLTKPVQKREEDSFIFRVKVDF